MVTGVVPHVGGPILPPCHPTTLIGFLPAARVGDMLTCVGPPDVIVKGSPTVLIGMMPAARMGDNTAHGGVIVLGHRLLRRPRMKVLPPRKDAPLPRKGTKQP
jgi:uncharacterized Zn-binding protein involved in type VI secretion